MLVTLLLAEPNWEPDGKDPGEAVCRGQAPL